MAVPKTETGIHWKYQNIETPRFLIYHAELRDEGPLTHIPHTMFSENIIQVFV